MKSAVKPLLRAVADGLPCGLRRVVYSAYHWVRGDELKGAVYDLNLFLESRGFDVSEGHVGDHLDENARFLLKAVGAMKQPEVIEIGFNAGHSSLVLLLGNKGSKVTSFDLCEHQYVSLAKEYVDRRFPARHTLICGDSRVTVPKFKTCHPERRFDLIFIDGDHSYEGAASDLQNCQTLAGEKALLIMDDVVASDAESREFNTGSSQAWRDWVAAGKVVEEEIRQLGSGRGFAVGRYRKED